MPTSDEAIRALTAILALAGFDPDGVLTFGRDRDSCIRSFWSYALQLPAYLLILGIFVAISLRPGDQVQSVMLADILTEILAAAGLPLLLRPILTRLGCGEKWFWLVTGLNWIAFPQMISELVSYLLELGPAWEIGMMLTYFVPVYFIVLRSFMIYTMLNIGGGKAIALAAMAYGFKQVLSILTLYAVGIDPTRL